MFKKINQTHNERRQQKNRVSRLENSIYPKMKNITIKIINSTEHVKVELISWKI